MGWSHEEDPCAGRSARVVVVKIAVELTCNRGRSCPPIVVYAYAPVGPKPYEEHADPVVATSLYHVKEAARAVGWSYDSRPSEFGEFFCSVCAQLMRQDPERKAS